TTKKISLTWDVFLAPSIPAITSDLPPGEKQRPWPPISSPKAAVSDGRVLVRITAAGVTPLEHTILAGGYPRAKAPLVLGGEGAGVVEEGGGTAFPAGSRVMFTGPYGVSENGTYSEWLAVRKENL